MNLKSTIALAILALAVGGLVWKGDSLAPRAGLAPQPSPPAKGKSANIVGQLTRENIAGIAISVPGSPPLDFISGGPGLPLSLPGNWPIRQNEVEELVAALTRLTSRFEPIPINEGDDLKPYGLAAAQQPVVVSAKTKEGTTTLQFGEPSAKIGENPFTRPAFVRVNSEPEVIQVGPEVLPVLRRPGEFYRKRQLFPDADRVKLVDSLRLIDPTSAFLVGDTVESIKVDGPNGSYTLRREGPSPKPMPFSDKPGADLGIVAARYADAWRLVEPLPDRVDPSKLKAILAVIPDLWVEQFVSPSSLLEPIRATLPPKFDEKDLPKQIGLGDDAMRLTLTMTNKTSRTIRFGKVLRNKTSTVPAPPPPFPGAPPSPPKIVDEKYYVAQIEGSPFYFEVKGDKLGDIFLTTSDSADGPKAELPGPAFQQIRDANAARFESEQVISVKVTRPGQVIELRKTKGDAKAETLAAKSDRWDIVAPFIGLAEAKQVTSARSLGTHFRQEGRRDRSAAPSCVDRWGWRCRLECSRPR